MTLPPYSSTREDKVHHLRCGPQSCRVGLCVRKCPREGNLFITVLEYNKQSRSHKEHIIMTKSIAGSAIPDSKLSTKAADARREYGNPLLWNHSHLVFLCRSLLLRQQTLQHYPPSLSILP